MNGPSRPLRGSLRSRLRMTDMSHYLLPLASHSFAGGKCLRRLQARAQRRHTPVAGRLVDHAVAPDRLRKDRRVGVLHHLEGVEASAQQEQKLIPQHIADGAQFAMKAKLLADSARFNLGASAWSGALRWADSGL